MSTIPKSCPLPLAKRMTKGSDIAETVNDAGTKDAKITLDECDSFARANPERADDARLLRAQVESYADASTPKKLQMWLMAYLS